MAESWLEVSSVDCVQRKHVVPVDEADGNQSTPIQPAEALPYEAINTVNGYSGLISSPSTIALGRRSKVCSALALRAAYQWAGGSMSQ
jgi:hypothetical protein